MNTMTMSRVHSTSVRSALVVMLAGLLSACSKPREDRRNALDVEPDDPAPVEVGERANAPGIRRLSVDQLEASVSVIAGSDLAGDAIQWTQNRDGTVLNAYDDAVFGKVLGRPDFVFETEQDRSTSPHYVKFAHDMALAVTQKMIEVDVARADDDVPTIWRHAPVDGSATAEQINENVRYLVLRFLGLDLTDSDPQVLALVAAYEATLSAVEEPDLLPYGPSVEGWRVVCITLFDDPAFHLY